MVVITRLRRFQQNDKLKFAPRKRTGRRREKDMIAAPRSRCLISTAGKLIFETHKGAGNPRLFCTFSYSAQALQVATVFWGL